MSGSVQARPSVLFVCVANSCRSQMAEAIAKSMVGDHWEIWSAGSHPSGSLHPVAMQMMVERGLNLTSHYSKGLEQVPSHQWDYVVSMGCGDACQTVQARQRQDWKIPDPVGVPPAESRRIRDLIEQLVRQLVHSTPSVPSGDPGP